LSQPLNEAAQALFSASAAELLAEQQRPGSLPQERFEDDVARYYA
jgi:hypothetical protein